MITILYKKLHPNAKAPARAHDGDAGWDVTAVSLDIEKKDGIMPDFPVITLGTGLAFAIPKGYWMMAAPRSSVYKQGLYLSNSLGIIDAGFRGEVKAMFYIYVNNNDHKMYDVGDRIIQLIPMPCRTDEVEFKEVEELPESWDGRGLGGFGSSGTRQFLNPRNRLGAAQRQVVHDAVDHPSHYCGFSNGAEVIDITENLSFNLGNCVKYCARAGRKHEDGMKDFEKRMEDLRKAKWYLEREITRLESGQGKEDEK